MNQREETKDKRKAEKAGQEVDGTCRIRKNSFWRKERVELGLSPLF
jgi:hypothetical protein